jgi:hypothetical protein
MQILACIQNTRTVGAKLTALNRARESPPYLMTFKKEEMFFEFLCKNLKIFLAENCVSRNCPESPGGFCVRKM